VTVESRRVAAPPMVLAATLGLAAACWATAAWLMNGMDMGVATRPGAFGFFAAAWVTMMAAMMLPGVAPAVARHARMTGKVRAALPFTGSCSGCPSSPSSPAPRSCYPRRPRSTSRWRWRSSDSDS